MNPREALGIVKELRRRVLARQRFAGYSGTARAGGGAIALFASLLAGLFGLGSNDGALLLLWGCVFAAAFALNYGAVLSWRIRNRIETEALAPALEPLPILFAGGVVTLACVAAKSPVILPCVWTSLVALTNFTGKYALPKKIRLVGAFYLFAGVLCLLLGAFAWRNPVFLGGLFFTGEWLGGWILHRENAAISAEPEPGNFTPVFSDDEN